jgi:integrase
MDESITNWLDTLSASYRNRAKYGFKRFFEFLRSEGWEEVTGELIINKHFENRRSEDRTTKFYFDDLMPKFLKYLVSQGLTNNSAVVTVNSVRGFFKYHREPLQVHRGRIQRREVRRKWHTPSIDELRQMVQIADLEEKAILMTGKDLGVRVGDFISLKRKPILDTYEFQQDDFPLEFEIETAKEGIVAIGHIMKETWDVLQLYWQSMPESEYVFPTNVNGREHISGDRANDVVKNTWAKAFPDNKDVPLRFHEFRALKISILANFGVNDMGIKRMTGKKVSADMLSYLTGIGYNYKEQFHKIEKAYSLTQPVTNNRIETMQVTIESMQERIDQLTQTVLRLARTLDDVEGIDLPEDIYLAYGRPEGGE